MTGLAEARAAVPPQPTPAAPPPQRRIAAAGGVLGVLLAAVVFARSGQVPGLLLLVGIALGFVLFHSRFGFSSAWRQLVAVRQGRALRAQMMMLAAACTLFAPILAHGTGLHGVAVSPTSAPLGWGLVVGAFLFGVGMQLGGSCASGTLYAAGSGQSAVVLTLGGFVVGATLGALTLPWWSALPHHDAVSLTRWGGYPGAWAISLTVMALVVGLTHLVGRGRTVPPVEPPPVAVGAARVVRGAWPLWVGALLLAGLDALTLWISGRAWSITFAFALWGSKLLEALGVDVLGWGFWQSPGNLASYRAGVLTERTSVMDLGIVIGALVASALAGSWTLHRHIPPRLALGAVVGGVLMGYGARLAGGCNIGAYLAGIASFSLHGWVWGVLALLGTVAGLRLRPLFGLTNPRPTDSVC